MRILAIGKETSGICQVFAVWKTQTVEELKVCYLMENEGTKILNQHSHFRSYHYPLYLENLKKIFLSSGINFYPTRRYSFRNVEGSFDSYEQNLLAKNPISFCTKSENEFKKFSHLNFLENFLSRRWSFDNPVEPFAESLQRFCTRSENDEKSQ